MVQEFERGAVRQKVTVGNRLETWWRRHRSDARQALEEMMKTPLSTLMTVLVLAITLALPAGLHVMLKNSQQVSQKWDGAPQVLLFLQSGLTNEAAEQLAIELRGSDKFKQVDYFSREQALDDFKTASGFGDALNYLDENPLPQLIVLRPKDEYTTPAAAEALVTDLQANPLVQIAQLDISWVKRLYAIMQVAERGVTALGVALGLAVLLIVGNTIRLAIHSRREEIQIIKLVGATDAFIRRPFLYSGLWYGLIAGVVCWFLVSLSLWWLQDPVKALAASYDSQYQLQGLGAVEIVQLLGFASLLGYLGSWLSVARHLRDINPA